MDKQKDTASANEVAICDCVFCKLERKLLGQHEPTTEQVQANMLESIRRLMEVHTVSFDELRVLVTEFANSRDRRQQVAPVEWPRGGYKPNPYTGPLKTPGGNPFKVNYDFSSIDRTPEQQEFDRKAKLALDNFTRMSPDERAAMIREFEEVLKRNAGYDY